MKATARRGWTKDQGEIQDENHVHVGDRAPYAERDEILNSTVEHLDIDLSVNPEAGSSQARTFRFRDTLSKEGEDVLGP